MPQMGASLRELQESLEKEHRRAFVPSEVAEVREKLREQHHEMINALPADSLGDGGMDVTDRATWYKSDDPELRNWAAEFLGVTGPETKRGLSNAEKELLFQASDADIERSTSPEAIRQFKKDDRAFNSALADLWPAYALAYPSAASDPEGAREAMSRLISASTLTKGQLAKLASTDRDALLTMIVSEQETPGAIVRSHWTNQRKQPAYDGNDDGSTQGFSSGSSGVRSYSAAPEAQPESLGDGISDWKRRNGFHR